MVITAAPFGSVAAVVNVHIQGDCLLLWDCSSWGIRPRHGGRDRETESKGSKEKETWMDGHGRDGQADVRHEAVSTGVRVEGF